jgi:Glycosyltransferase family 87
MWALGGSALFVAVVAGIPGSPLQPILPFGAQPLLPFRAAARAVGLDTLQPVFQATVAIVAVLGSAIAFLFALRETWRGTIALRAVLWLGIALVALAVLLPLLFSRDVYSYSMYGRIESLHHANPYVSTPQDFARDPFFPLVGPQWRNTRAVYGPGFTLLSAGLTSWLRSPVALIWVFKVIAGLADVATIVLVARLSRRLWPRRAAFATALVAWNPVVLFHGVGGGHNDLLVALSIAGALGLLAGGTGARRDDGSPASPRRARELLATAVLVLGTLVKATVAIPLVGRAPNAHARSPGTSGSRLRCSWPSPHRNSRRRIRRTDSPRSRHTKDGSRPADSSA